jgi:hypothetical protein
MDGSPDDSSAVTGGTGPDKRQLAREMAEEFLGRGAGIARASIKPLGILGRVALVAGLVIWVAGPAPFWENAPHMLSGLLTLALFAFPGVRLLRHQARMRTVLEDLPTLLDNVTGAMSTMTGTGDLRARWSRSGEAAKGGLVGSARRALSFYRNDLAPLRQGPHKLVGQVNDALSAFGAPALALSGIASLLAVVLLVLCPIAVVVRLIILAS